MSIEESVQKVLDAAKLVRQSGALRPRECILIDELAEEKDEDEEDEDEWDEDEEEEEGE
jgi:hypothetical protein